MPQWDFLNFILEQGKRYSGFQVRMQTQATGLIEENGRVVGVSQKLPAAPSKSALLLPSEPTAGIRLCANGLACR